MSKRLFKVFSITSILALFFTAMPMQNAQAVSASIVISQFQVAGASAADEFIELHNVGSTSFDLNGHRLVYRAAAGVSDVSLVTWTTTTIIPAGGYYLAAAAMVGATPAGYDGEAAPDATFSHTGLGALSGTGGGLALRNGAANTGSIIDSVGYGTATNAFVEDTVTAAPAANLSKARKELGCQDTDNNSNDFETINPSTPRNTDSPMQLCGAGVTFIHEIQGGSSAVTSAGPFMVEAIVVGDYQTQGSGQLRGFFIQEEDADADANPATSEGIFVFCNTCPTAVTVGDKVRVTGSASEFFDMSQLTASTVASVTVLSSGNPLPTPANVTLPVPGVPDGDLTAATAAINEYLEAFEGMLVTFPSTLSVSDYFELARYGQVTLTAGGRPHTFTAVNTPTTAGYINHQIDLARRSIILDDTDNAQNSPIAVTPNTSYYHPTPGLSTSNYFRGGDTITNLTGVLHWSFAGQAGTDEWRIRPVTEAYNYAFTPVNPRPGVPNVGGSLKVASFNVLNYFLNIDTSDTCSPSLNQDCRGADSAQELERQRAKLLAALAAIDADVIGLMELENTPGVEPLADLVAGLPGYGFIDTGVVGTDAIRVGIMYKTTTVQPAGSYAILDSSIDPRFVDTRNRPALAQSFEEISSGARFTVVVNHLKSKGSGCGAGDDDTTTGQGNCNGTRTLAAQALADWLAADPTGSGDPDVLIIGDLNSYAKEDPIVALQNAGYTDLVAAFGGETAYGYVFDGQLGYLDHALSNASLTPQVTGVAEWHINADEIPLFDYNDDQVTADESSFEKESDAFPLYEANEFRTSDHDPVIIGLALTSPYTKTVTFYSQAKNDGWVLESVENSNMGGSKNHTSNILQIGDDALNRQYRSILSFNTAEIPDGVNIASVTLKIKLANNASGSPFNIFQGLMVDVRKGNFGKPDLQLGDFKRGTVNTHGPFHPILILEGWFTGSYEIDLTSGAAFINDTGNTQIRLRFNLGGNNNNIPNIMRFYSGNSIKANRPRLIIQYNVP